MADEEQETGEVEETADVHTSETESTPEEPPAWFKQWQASQAKPETKTVPKPTKTAPAKKTPPAAPKPKPAETDNEERPKKTRGGVSRAWFGGRAE